MRFRSFSELYWGAGLDVTVLGLHWVPREGWATCWFGTPQQCSDLQTRSAGDAAHTAAHLVASLARQHALQPAQLEIGRLEWRATATLSSPRSGLQYGDGGGFPDCQAAGR